MPIPGRNSALLVGHRNALRTEGGGVQVCSREYQVALEAAGYQLRPVPFEFKASIGSRALQRLLPNASIARAPASLLESILTRLNEEDVNTVFFAFNLFSEVSCALRSRFPHVRQVLLSYGVESIDSMLAELLVRRAGLASGSRATAERRLGRQLLEEAEQRHWIDAALTLSPLEVEVEKWLGTARVLWVPRLILEPPLQFQPVNGRVGCASTLNHPPNLDGLVRLFDVLGRGVRKGFRFRLVGQPAEKGEELAARYSFVDYLGPHSEADLRKEAATWCCFVHPLFVNAKGCSTKLATGIGWGLPIATTESGARGYAWIQGLLPLATTPEELAQLAVDRSSAGGFEGLARETDALRAAAPSLSAVGAILREFLAV